MPELPEVETTRNGIAPYLVGRRVQALVIRQPHLRWPIDAELVARLPGQRIEAVERRAKYLLVHTAVGSAIAHLGMSGSLRVLASDVAVGKHDHYDWRLGSGRILRYTDPRRFGCLLWQSTGTTHELLADLGPEPLSDAFDGDHLWRLSRGRKAAVKTFIMDQGVVVGVGNIYAAEALFAARIHPNRAAGAVARARYAHLADAIRHILAHAIRRGGTTLRDFISPDGVPGYFEQELFVYGRAGEPCRACGTPVRAVTLGQRSTFYCPRCQR
ncbi:MAG TPA: bifunctional DNA-formamidopyrimidine glycosylase/DNA-(apurinic or apyrimidinic site) lyase [Dokdonella sp.]|uniref:bifunctional DNA-formamidopyrimidine glycosylase/DNA-(apurinic or apyrimidinic site) lyase n=1 Tax=Dokdonella sp. TaxID=2291710 RepID=UPI0025C17123|nr:bifunctional DNA-formamidopyrimidine glycosylase/DNA-(apurinic or apyrimidinic site) lyase [Dokdonella sp.]MBX3691540.1 bifunctional DNA-formamidopyrimidine glycosylase/DNA-(apurinic or apyrimidinic site) lyase [Dokdonella sp.]MCW5568397.1 bifunctional DNA-formamidopyrimidine glycosylase/DNA-(apurinic or apyrimidinic site) lyase [Dokdonella sp.]HNR92021.1 bifunctional DNA-formamidopyrimidine glycosylase/DNA-(apurinic or apyrimidinic site) lyase [Dokdonella sp.]